MLNSEGISHQSVDVIQHQREYTQQVDQNTSLNNMGEGIINLGVP